MKKIISLFSLTLLLLSSGLYAQEETQVKTMGLLIKNRKTSEIIGLRCEKMAKDKMCLEFQFLLLSRVKDDEMQILAKIGEPKTYEELNNVLESVKLNVFHAYRNESFINDSGIDLSVSDYNDLYLEKHLTGVSTFMITGDNGWSKGGKIWRRIVGVVSLPVFLVADGARYAAEALIASGEIVGETVVYGAVGLTYDLPDELHAKSKAKKADIALRKTNQKRFQGKVKRVSHRLFGLIKSRIVNY